MRELFPALLRNSAIKELAGGDILLAKSSHAYIIDGPQGSGKHTAALEIAKALLCENKDNGALPLPCGKCLSCRKADDGFNSCINYINSGDKATISVEKIRQSLSTVNYLPDDGDKSIYIIEDAEKMSTSAQNALLLTLEEPPAHVVFILLTVDSAALLETVRSRAHILKTELFTPSYILSILSSELGYSDRIQDAAAAAGGSLGLAKIIASSADDAHIIHRRTSGELVHLLTHGSVSEILMFFRDLKIDRSGASVMLMLTMSAIRDLIAYRTGSTSLTYYTNTEDAANAAGTASVAYLSKIYREVEAARDDICQKNASAMTVFSTLACAASGRHKS